MKREIKFRAYRKSTQNICNVLSIDFEKEWVLLSDGDEEDISAVELMQYTGLHDKNGREIYEGDIVRYHMTRSFGEHYDPVTLGFIGTDWDIDADIIGKVSIWPSNGVMMTKIVTNDPDMFSKQYPVPKRWHVTQDCKVIGNIYENPELLEAEK